MNGLGGGAGVDKEEEGQEGDTVHTTTILCSKKNKQPGSFFIEY